MEQERERRSPQQSAIASRAARALAAPFLDRFDEWNSRAALLGASVSSPATSEEEAASLIAQIRELQVQVAKAHAEFLETIADQPRHGRLDDVNAAFLRLLSALKNRLR